MTTINYCTNQQIIEWHYRTVCRYQLAEIPAASKKITKFVYSITNNVKSNKFLQFLKIKKVLDFTTKANRVYLKAGKQLFNNKANLQKINNITSIGHIKFWKHINNITVHITSGKLLSNIELYPSFYTAFNCLGNQSPQVIKSKRAVAEFKVIKGAIIGGRVYLQKHNKYYFLYKWGFIAANTTIPSNEFIKCLGITNIFIFPELDKYNYYLFKSIKGFDLHFNAI